MDDIQFDECVTLHDAKLTKTRDGYHRTVARVARTGIQTYRGYEVGRPDLDMVRVYRAPEEVFASDTLRSFAWRTVTNDHPPEEVNADNWKKYAVGITGGDIDARDGRFVSVPLILMDAATIRDYESGKKRQLSMGYQSKLIWGDGVSPEGDAYHARQTAIVNNHLALVTTARGGAELSLDKGDETMPKILTLDGLSVTINDERDAAIITRHIEKLTTDAAAATQKLATVETQIGTLTGTVAARDGEIVALKQQVESGKLTPQVLDAKVHERMDVINKAKALMQKVNKPLVTDSQTNDDVRKQVVVAMLGDEQIKGWSAEKIGGYFDGCAATVDPVASAISSNNGQHYQADATETAYAEYSKHISDAWRPAV
jgi:hypothetical protein